MGKKNIILCGAIAMLSVCPSALHAQIPTSSSQSLQAYPVSATPVIFRTGTDISECTVPESPVKWGMDVAWDSEDNVIRGTNYIGKDALSIGRVSFQPSDLVGEDGSLSYSQQNSLASRLRHIAKSGVKDILLNCDHESLNSANYYGKPVEWYKVIKASVLYCQLQGFNVVAIAPFNEPDYTGWGEGTQAHFKEIARLISSDADLAGIRITAGNTLNCDQALSWYNYMKPYVGEGSTHQLAGSFDNYANFWKTVRADGNLTMADEMHNVGEAFIGVHYGLQSGVWWGYEAAARGEYCRSAFYGKEIGYGENRDCWSAATVYKRPEGRIDAFLGVSERQAYTSSYEFVSTDRPVYYDGYGPTYNYFMEMPGGTGYATEDQRNAERLIQVQYGEDVPVEPIANGQYVIMNRGSQKAIGFPSSTAGDGASLTCGTYTTTRPATYQQWIIEPVSPRIGSDFSYFYIKSVRNNRQMFDVLNWSTSPGGSVCGFSGGGGANELWLFEYAGNGDWYIRSRHSGLYLDGKIGTVLQQTKDTTSLYQRWRLMPTDASRDIKAPTAPTGLSALPRSASVLLSWNANTESDIVGYQVQRDGDVIGRMIQGTQFIDNTLTPGVEHTYSVKAIDRSRNRSAASETVTCSTSDVPALVARYCFNKSLNDTTENMLNAVYAGKETYSSSLGKKEGSTSISINATNNTYLLLPVAAVDHEEMTISAWVYSFSTNKSWTRIFDFGNGTDQYMFLTPSNGSEMRLAIKNGGEEQVLSVGKKMPSGMHHVALTFSRDSVLLYIDGEKVAGTADITIRPSDFHPVRNFIGRSQFASDPLFTGYIDDFRIYNYSLSPSEVKQVCAGEDISSGMALEKAVNASPSAKYNIAGQRVSHPDGMYIMNGRKYIAR